MKDQATGPVDLWIQAASGGESMLAAMVITALAESPGKKTLRILVTSGTQQGIESLHKGCGNLQGSGVTVTIRYFPFDAPHLMDKAFTIFTPRLAMTVETELWPSFLVCAQKRNIPVFLINGRMSEKSFRSYRHFRSFFRRFGPTRIWAISPDDRDRFAEVMGKDRVMLMNNLKFDRIVPKKEPDPGPLKTFLPPDTDFVLLGSIRREEEEQILTTTVNLLERRSDIIIGLFPKHIERADHWLQLLSQQGIPAQKRSSISTPPPPGSVIVWDTFGELASAYGLARAAFVGGSLVNLGGQNFLEPLVFGLRPIIGPYWKNFAWVGRDIVKTGLVIEVDNSTELLTELLACLDRKEEKKHIRQRVDQYFSPRQGGTRLIREAIEHNLHL